MMIMNIIIILVIIIRDRIILQVKLVWVESGGKGFAQGFEQTTDNETRMVNTDSRPLFNPTRTQSPDAVRLPPPPALSSPSYIHTIASSAKLLTKILKINRTITVQKILRIHYYNSKKMLYKMTRICLSKTVGDSVEIFLGGNFQSPSK